MRVLIVDDEAMARRRLVRLVSALPEITLVGELSSAEELLARAREGGVDLVLLDIDMGELSGLEAMRLLPEGGPLVIFVTAHAEHAVAAFDAGAVDYVLKPVDAGRLKKALDRAALRHEARSDVAPGGEVLADRLAVPTRRGLLVIAPEELHYALVDGESLILHTARGVLVTDFRVAALERRLPPEKFVRAHRRVLLNIDHVVALEAVGASTFVAELRDGAKVPVSRQAGKRLRARWVVD